MRTRVKFCGMTRAEDIHCAVEAGVDAIGFVFVPHSKRYIDITKARSLREHVPPFVSTVALFLDADAAFVRHVNQTMRPDYLQFHGQEDSAFCDAFKVPYLKAVAMRSVGDLAAYTKAYPQAKGFLLDGHGAGELGGQGQVFDWSRVPLGAEQKYLLAGGLNCGNVKQAIQTAQPWGIDLSSGIESSPGIKDSTKMLELMHVINSLST